MSYAISFQSLQSSTLSFISGLLASKQLSKKLIRKCQIFEYLTSRLIGSASDGCSQLDTYAKQIAFNTNQNTNNSTENSDESEKRFIQENMLDILLFHGKCVSADSSGLRLSNSGSTTALDESLVECNSPYVYNKSKQTSSNGIFSAPNLAAFTREPSTQIVPATHDTPSNYLQHFQATTITATPIVSSHQNLLSYRSNIPTLSGDNNNNNNNNSNNTHINYSPVTPTQNLHIPQQQSYNSSNSNNNNNNNNNSIQLLRGLDLCHNNTSNIQITSSPNHRSTTTTISPYTNSHVQSSNPQNKLAVGTAIPEEGQVHLPPSPATTPTVVLPKIIFNSAKNNNNNTSPTQVDEEFEEAADYKPHSARFKAIPDFITSANSPFERSPVKHQTTAARINNQFGSSDHLSMQYTHAPTQQPGIFYSSSHQLSPTAAMLHSTGSHKLNSLNNNVSCPLMIKPINFKMTMANAMNINYSHEPSNNNNNNVSNAHSLPILSNQQISSKISSANDLLNLSRRSSNSNDAGTPGNLRFDFEEKSSHNPYNPFAMLMQVRCTIADFKDHSQTIDIMTATNLFSHGMKEPVIIPLKQIIQPIKIAIVGNAGAIQNTPSATFNFTSKLQTSSQQQEESTQIMKAKTNGIIAIPNSNMSHDETGKLNEDDILKNSHSIRKISVYRQSVFRQSDKSLPGKQLTTPLNDQEILIQKYTSSMTTSVPTSRMVGAV